MHRRIQCSRIEACPSSCSTTWPPDIHGAPVCLFSRVGVESCCCVCLPVRAVSEVRSRTCVLHAIQAHVRACSLPHCRLALFEFCMEPGPRSAAPPRVTSFARVHLFVFCSLRAVVHTALRGARPLVSVRMRACNLARPWLKRAPCALEVPRSIHVVHCPARRTAGKREPVAACFCLRTGPSLQQMQETVSAVSCFIPTAFAHCKEQLLPCLRL